MIFICLFIFFQSWNAQAQITLQNQIACSRDSPLTLDCRNFGNNHRLFIVFAKLIGLKDRTCVAHAPKTDCMENANNEINEMCNDQAMCNINLNAIPTSDTCFADNRQLAVIYTCIDDFCRATSVLPENYAGNGGGLCSDAVLAGGPRNYLSKCLGTNVETGIHVETGCDIELYSCGTVIPNCPPGFIIDIEDVDLEYTQSTVDALNSRFGRQLTCVQNQAIGCEDANESAFKSSVRALCDGQTSCIVTPPPSTCPGNQLMEVEYECDPI